MGIALIAFAPPPHSNGHSGALHLGKKCPKPFGQGSRPPKIKQILPKKVAPNHPGKGLDPPPPLTGNAQMPFTLFLGGLPLDRYQSFSLCETGSASPTPLFLLLIRLSLFFHSSFPGCSRSWESSAFWPFSLRLTFKKKVTW